MSGSDAKPPATLSLDLDNLWAYLRTHGDGRWREYPSYLDRAVPRLLRLFDSLDVKITVFVVGRDLTAPFHEELFAAIAEAGHELGNHSYEHSVDFHRADQATVVDEITRTGSAIAAISGRNPVGFRGPSYRLSNTIIETLTRLGYRYDASTFPTFAGPLARAFHVATSKLDAAGKARVRDLFGSMRDGLQPLNPYRWDIDGEALYELPVTTFPLIRTPIHLTYLNFIADYSPLLARAYLKCALNCCRVSRIAPSLLLHATDFIGADDDGCPQFLPGMKRTGEQKIEFLRDILERYLAMFDVMPMADYARTVAAKRALRRVDPGIRP